MEKARPSAVSRCSFFIVGYPVRHSASPYIYNKLFARVGLDASYCALEVRPELLGPAVSILRESSCGFNVTAPHKVAVLGYLDDVDELASEVGAVNTVVRSSGRLKGYNTDWIGVEKALEEQGGLVGKKLKKALLVGAGGAARAAAYALAQHAEELVVVSATGVTAAELARRARKWGFGSTLGARADDPALVELCRGANLVVNASPVAGSGDRLPVPSDCLESAEVVLDLVYNPLRTALLAKAESLGSKAVDGLWVLCYQAVENLKLWLGLEVEVGELRKLGEEALAVSRQ